MTRVIGQVLSVGCHEDMLPGIADDQMRLESEIP